MNKKLTIVPPEGYEIDKDEFTFDKIVFKPSLRYDWREIKSFSNACNFLGIESTNTIFSIIDSTDILALKQLKVIFAAINQGWYPDWNNNNQSKYIVYFEYFRNCFDVILKQNTQISTLCLESYEKAKHVIKYFSGLYKQYLQIN